MFVLSFCIHLVVFLIVARFQTLGQFHPEEAPVTYVDLMALPVASPQSGTPAPAAGSAPSPPPPPAAAKPEMALPAPKAKTKTAQPKPAPEKPSQAKTEKPKAEESREFDERMAKLERQAEEKQLAGALERLKNRGSGGRVGMPGAKGTEAGSDYASYVQSRLKDAFREVMAAQSKSPQVIATITIGPDGRIAEYRVEKASGDPIFDDAVARAVTLAGRSLKPPPGGGQFKRVFRFRPEGVGVR